MKNEKWPLRIGCLIVGAAAALSIRLWYGAPIYTFFQGIF